MKIRPQLILVEVLLSTVLFLSILFSISSFAKFLEFEDLKIRTATLSDTAGQVRFAVLDMLIKTEPDSYLLSEYSILEDKLTEDLASLASEATFKRLPDYVRDQFDVIISSWDLTKRTFNSVDITGFLKLREEIPGDEIESLQNIQAVMRETGDLSFVMMESIDDAVLGITATEVSFDTFDGLLERALNDILNAADNYRNNQLILSISLPAFILILSLLGILFYTTILSRKLRHLDTALVNIGGGDFTIRVDMKGKDEFNSLATSINAFTRTLGAKLESFRLMMHEIGQTLSADVESIQVEETLIRLAMKDTIADGAALYKVSGEAGELILSVSEGRFHPPFLVADLPDAPEKEDIEAILRSRIIQPGRTIIGESAISGHARMIRDVRKEKDIDWSRSESDPLFLSSIIVVPLQVGTIVSGALVVTSSKPGRLFSDLEFANMQSFGELAAITLDNIYKYADLLEATQLNRELGIAEEIQQDLLPKRLPRLQAGNVAYLSRSIKGLNGDYFDVYPLGDGKTLITICEVAGRGVPAGLVMVMIRTILRLVSTSEMDAKSIMTRLNLDMTQRIAIENYASVGILILDNDGSFTFSSAAHYPLQILRSGGDKYEAVQTEGIPVGIDREAVYHQEIGQLSKDDLVLFHTDGIPESRNRDGKIFGIDSLLKTVGNQAGENPEDIIEALRLELEHFEKGTDQKDDQTVIILKYTGGEAA